MNKSKISLIVISLLGLALAVYSASRGIHFISQTLPADRYILAWFAIGATELGFIGWVWHFTQTRAIPRQVAGIMALVDFIGVSVLMIGDSLLVTGQKGLTQVMAPGQIWALTLVMGLIIAANIGAIAVVHIADPNTLKKIREQAARDRIDNEALTLISENAEGLAAEVAPIMAGAWREKTRRQYLTSTQARDDQGQALPVEMVTVPNDREEG